MSESNDKNRWRVLFITVLFTFMAVLDGSIVNVALPTMSNRLAVSMASIEWVITSYLIAIIALLLIFGRLADIIGKTRIFKMGIVVFTIGSFLCGISNSLIILVISRIVQAIGAAGTMATSHGIITNVFPQNERGKALGINGTAVALGAMVGPPLGGFMVSIFNWESIFLINVPIGIIAYILALRVFGKKSSTANETLDAKGAILFTLFIVLLFGTLTRGKEIGYANPLIIAAFLFAIIFFVSFLYVEERSKIPLIDLEIFKNPLFSLSIFCGFISFIAINCSNIILPFYLQYVMKLTPQAAGFVMMISPIVLSIVAPISGHVSDKRGAEVFTFLGLLITSLGLFFISTLTQYSAIWHLAVFLIIVTLGSGMFQSPNNALVMSNAAKNKLGVAGSINALVRNLGMIVGVSLSTTILYNSMSNKVGYHVTGYISGREDVFMYGMKYVYITAAIICATGAILTAYRIYKIRRTI